MPKSFKILPKWWNFAKSAYTGAVAYSTFLSNCVNFNSQEDIGNAQTGSNWRVLLTYFNLIQVELAVAHLQCGQIGRDLLDFGQLFKAFGNN